MFTRLGLNWLAKRAVDPRREHKAAVEVAVAILLIAFAVGYCTWRG